MNSVAKAVLFAAAIAAPVASFAQSGQPVTRAQVRAELIQVEKAGYEPQDWTHYPENLQTAEAKVAAQNAEAQGSHSAFGGATDGTSRSGPAQGM